MEKKKEIYQYLQAGRYFILNKNNYFKISFSNIIENFRDISKSLLQGRLNFCYKKEVPQDEISGNIVLRRKLDGQLIIIDKNKWVYRKYKDEEQFRRVRKGHESLEQLYKINKLIILPNIITKEKFLKGKTLDKISSKKQNEVFEDILHTFHENFNKDILQSFSSRISYEKFFKKTMEIEYPKEMKTFLLDNSERAMEIYNNFIWLYNHGDLTPRNIIFAENFYSLMDGERCEILPAFYDIANLMNNNILMSNNSYSYDRYFNGSYDFVLEKVFQLSKIQNKDRKLIIVLMLFIKGIIAWDAEIKCDDISLFKKRWKAVNYYFEKEK